MTDVHGWRSMKIVFTQRNMVSDWVIWSLRTHKKIVHHFLEKEPFSKTTRQRPRSSSVHTLPNSSSQNKIHKQPYSRSKNQPGAKKSKKIKPLGFRLKIIIVLVSLSDERPRQTEASQPFQNPAKQPHTIHNWSPKIWPNNPKPPNHPTNFPFKERALTNGGSNLCHNSKGGGSSDNFEVWPLHRTRRIIGVGSRIGGLKHIKNQMVTISWTVLASLSHAVTTSCQQRETV